MRNVAPMSRLQAMPTRMLNAIIACWHCFTCRQVVKVQPGLRRGAGSHASLWSA